LANLRSATFVAVLSAAVVRRIVESTCTAAGTIHRPPRNHIEPQFAALR
jgi:hypothetical protein